jgi:uncharacterized peroxidase-related enzyme
MAHVKPLARDQLAEFEPLFKMVEATMGFVPNSMLTMGRRPDILRAFAGLAGAVLGGGSVPPDLKQLVAYIASTAAGCRYCQAHTAGAAARIGVDGSKLADAWDFERSARFTPAEKAALTFARDAAIIPNAVTGSHFDDLRKHFNDAEIVELMAVIALFGWLNRWNDTMATELEAEAREFASTALAPRGWAVGKHAA